MACPKYARFGAMLSVMFSLAILVLFTPPLRADSAGSESAESSSNPAPQRGSPSGFRIREPKIFIGGHLGINLPREDSDIYGMVTRELTLKKSDFRTPVYGFDVGGLFASHWAAVFGLEGTGMSKDSESRNWVDENGQLIRQTTRFRLIYVTGTARYYPIKFGEAVGSHAWIPSRVLPYVGGGAGLVHYRFMQEGSFVDNQTLDIFDATFESKHIAFTKHLVAGVDISITPLIMLNAEARYSWARSDMSGGFRGFQRIDLSGLRVSGGICFRF